MARPPTIHLALLLGAAALLSFSAAKADEIIHPELRKRMTASRPGQAVDCYLVMKDQLTLEYFSPKTRGMSPRAARRIVAEELKRHAAWSQADVRALLECEVEAGRCEIIDFLWMGNAVLLSAEPSTITRLSTLRGIDRIRPIVDHDLEAFADVSPTGTGQSKLPLSLPGPGTGPIVPEPNIVQLQAPMLWDIGYDGQGILIGNIDLGTQWLHADLINRTWNNPGEIPDNQIDDDLNGYVDDIVGWDFDSNDNDPVSANVHGTGTAGLMVGDGDNGKITGMAIGGSMLICRVVDEAAYWQAQQYCLDQAVDVISSSLSFRWFSTPRPDYHMFRQLCEMELAAAIIHANSLGNFGNLLGNYPIPFNIGVPGNCPSPWQHPDAQPGGLTSVMGCAGIHVDDDSLYDDSGRGPSAWEDITLYDAAYPHTQDVSYWDYPFGGFGGGLPALLKPDIVAYTDPVTTLGNGNTYITFSGTSASTPQLGGAMVLLRHAQPEALPRHITAALELTAVDLGTPGKDCRYGSGKLQAFDAARRLALLVRVDEPLPSIDTTINFDLFGEPGEMVSLYWSAEIEDGDTDLNLVPPRTLMGVYHLDGSGKHTAPLVIPLLPSLIGTTRYYQAESQLNNPDWGIGQVWSVPEKVTFQPAVP